MFEQMDRISCSGTMPVLTRMRRLCDSREIIVFLHCSLVQGTGVTGSLIPKEYSPIVAGPGHH